MKRILRVALLLLGLGMSMGASAETHYKPHISIGGRAGVSMARMSFSPSVKQAMNTGTCGAVTFRYTEEKLFGIVAEFGWEQRGWKENFEEHPFAYKRSLTYLTLPVLTHIYFGSRRFKTYVNLGPSVSYLLSSSIDADFDYRNTESVEGFPRNRQTEQLHTEVSNKFDYGILGGLGFEFYLTPRQSITLEARYYFGLGSIFPSSKADTFSASRNTSIAITLGYNFRIR